MSILTQNSNVIKSIGGEVYKANQMLVDLDFTKKVTLVNTNEVSEWGDINNVVKYRQATQSKRPILSAEGLEFNATNNSELYRNNDGIGYSNMIVKIEWIPRTSGNYILFNKALSATDRIMIYYYGGRYYFAQAVAGTTYGFSCTPNTLTLSSINRFVFNVSTDANNVGKYYIAYFTGAAGVYGFVGSSGNGDPNLINVNGTFLIGEEVANNFTSGNFALRKIRIEKHTGFTPNYLDAKVYAEAYVNGLIN